jgi:putative transposase
MNQGFVRGVNLVTLITNFREQKRLEQTKRRGRRLSIVGLFQHEISFVYGLVIGGVDRKAYIKMMESEAQSASQSKRIRVIVQDNGPIHRCHEVQQLWSKWESEGLYSLSQKDEV